MEPCNGCASATAYVGANLDAKEAHDHHPGGVARVMGTNVPNVAINGS